MKTKIMKQSILLLLLGIGMTVNVFAVNSKNKQDLLKQKTETIQVEKAQQQFLFKEQILQTWFAKKVQKQAKKIKDGSKAGKASIWLSISALALGLLACTSSFLAGGVIMGFLGGLAWIFNFLALSRLKKYDADKKLIRRSTIGFVLANIAFSLAGALVALELLFYIVGA